MKKITLERLESSDHGTFGRLILPEFTLFTGELPWLENASNISCIPEGTYFGDWTYSPRFARKMYLLTPVDGRTGIRIHPANLMGNVGKGFKAQLNGCIALGEKLGWINKQKAVLISQPAVRRLETYLGSKTFELEIKCLAS